MNDESLIDELSNSSTTTVHIYTHSNRNKKLTTASGLCVVYSINIIMYIEVNVNYNCRFPYVAFFQDQTLALCFEVH